jgi:hypothetical protein
MHQVERGKRLGVMQWWAGARLGVAHGSNGTNVLA